VLYLLALPFLLLLSLKQKYKESIPARFFLKNNPPLDETKIWFHGCSFGEVRSLKPLLEYFKDSGITTTTQTGFAQAKKLCANSRYLPFEIWLPFWVQKHKVLVVLEAELWYLLFLCAKQKGATTILLSARISDRSYKSYIKFRKLYEKIFENVDLVFAQSQKDRMRLLELGAKNVEVAGNIKLANLPTLSKKYPKPQKLLITAASTHEGEELKVLKSFIGAKLENATIVIVPRHPERFEAVDRLIQQNKQAMSYHRWSQSQSFESDIVLVDVMGELNNIYAVSDITILCGSFAKVGGHNPIEPAYFNNKIISGEHYFNQQATYEYIENIVITNNLQESLANHKQIKPAKIKAQEFDLKKVIKRIEDASI